MIFINLLLVGFSFSCVFLMINRFLGAQADNDYKTQVLSLIYMALNVCAFVLNLTQFIKIMFVKGMF